MSSQGLQRDLELLCDLDEPAPARSILGGKFPDAGGATQQVDAVEEIDDTHAHRERFLTVAPGREIAGERGVPLRVLRRMLEVGETRAQAAAVNAVQAGEHGTPTIRSAGRSRDRLRIRG